MVVSRNIEFHFDSPICITVYSFILVQIYRGGDFMNYNFGIKNEDAEVRFGRLGLFLFVGHFKDWIYCRTGYLIVSHLNL